MEPWGTLTFMINFVESFKCGTSMSKLGEAGSRFPAAAPNHPEALLARPQAFQAVGEKLGN